MNQINLPAFSIAVVAVLLSACQTSEAAASSAARAVALCADARTHSARDEAGRESLMRYSGKELVTQDGDDATVEFFADRAAGTPGSTIHYERITRRDAQALGFNPERGMAVFMLHGDEGMPSAFVTLPEHMAEIASRHFTGAYGTSRDDGGYDVTQMSCDIL